MEHNHSRTLSLEYGPNVKSRRNEVVKTSQIRVTCSAFLSRIFVDL